MSIKKEKGFNLVELMLVLVVISILAAVATLFYNNYVIRTNRTDVETAMVQVGQKLEAYKLVNNNYSGAALTNTAIYGGTNYPLTGTITYTLGLTITATGWTLTATPTGKQTGNGSLVLNDQGWKCWNNPNGDATNVCSSGAPTANTTWEGK